MPGLYLVSPFCVLITSVTRGQQVLPCGSITSFFYSEIANYRKFKKKKKFSLFNDRHFVAPRNLYNILVPSFKFQLHKAYIFSLEIFGLKLEFRLDQEQGIRLKNLFKSIIFKIK